MNTEQNIQVKEENSLPELDLSILEETEEEIIQPVELPENIETALNKINDWFSKVFLNGVQRISKENLDELQALIITAHTTKVARLERDIQSLKKIMELYLNKDPTFNFSRITSILSRIAITCKTIRDYKNGKQLSPRLIKLLTGTQDEKKEYKKIIAQTLGVSGWMTESGFVGVTAYLYDLSNRQIIAATNARPLTAMKYMDRNRYRRSRRSSSSSANSELRNIETILNINTNSDISMNEFTSASFQIWNAKITQAYPSKLSLGKYLKLFRYKALPWISSKFKTIKYDDWIEVQEHIHNIESEGLSLFPQLFGLFKIKRFSEMKHDDIERTYSFKVYDKNYNSMDVTISDKGRNHYTIETFKDLISSETFPPWIFGQARIASDGNMSFWPISGIWPLGVMLSDYRIIEACDFSLNQMKFRSR